MKKVEKSINRPVRIDVSLSNIELLYKCIFNDKSHPEEPLFTGKVLDISNGGMQFVGVVPVHFSRQIAEEEMLLGCNIFLPDDKIKVLARVRWLASFQKSAFCRPWPLFPEKMLHKVGVQFVQMDQENKVKLQSYMIKRQIMTSRLNRAGELLLNPKYVGDVE